MVARMVAEVDRRGAMEEDVYSSLAEIAYRSGILDLSLCFSPFHGPI